MTDTAIDELLQKAAALIKQNQLPAAEICVKQALEKNPNHVKSLFQAAVIASKMHKFDSAIAYCNQVLAHTPGNSEAMTLLGNNHLAKKEGLKALEWFQKSIAANPKNPTGYLNAGACCNHIELYEQAAQYLEQGIAIGATGTEMYNQLGVAYEEMGQLVKAVECYRRAMALWQGTRSIVYNYSYFLFADQECKSLADYAKSVRKTECLKEHQVEGLRILELLCQYLDDDTKRVNEILTEMPTLKGTADSYPNAGELSKYFHCIREVATFREQHPALYKDSKEAGAARTNKTQENLYIIGDAHCLPQAHMKIPLGTVSYHCTSKFLIGLNAQALAQSRNNKHKARLHTIIKNLPAGSKAVIMCGQADCQFEGGILSHCKHNKITDWKAIDSLILQTVHGLVGYVASLVADKKIDITFYGVPATNIDVGKYSAQEQELQKKITRTFNEYLAIEAKRRKAQFIDVYKITADDQGNPVKKYYFDANFLRPDVFLGVSQILAV